MLGPSTAAYGKSSPRSRGAAGAPPYCWHMPESKYPPYLVSYLPQPPWLIEGFSESEAKHALTGATDEQEDASRVTATADPQIKERRSVLRSTSRSCLPATLHVASAFPLDAPCHM